MNISVIIPVYNVERFVGRCVTSIMNQTYTEDVECIIVNDCTPDRSMEIVEELVAQYNGPIQFKILQHEHNRGVAAVRNTGIDAATGNYVICIDSDDYCEPDMLEKMYTKAVEKDADIVIVDHWETHETYETYFQQIIPSTITDRLKALLTDSLSVVVWNRMYRRKLCVDNHIKSVEGIDFGEDLLFNIYLFYYAVRVEHIPHAFIHHIHYNTSSYTKSMSLNSLQNILKGENAMMLFFDNLEIKKILAPYLLERRMKNRFTLLFHAKGALQKEWNALYYDIPFNFSLKYLFTSKSRKLYWRLPLFFASLKILWPFNIARMIWRTLRKSNSTIYQKLTK